MPNTGWNIWLFPQELLVGPAMSPFMNLLSSREPLYPRHASPQDNSDSVTDNKILANL
jgi:hypothetical protein